MAEGNPSFWDALRSILGPGRLWRAPESDRICSFTPDARELVLVLHQFGGNPRFDLASLVAAIRDARPRADIVVPVLPLYYPSFHEPNRIVRQVLEELDEIVQRKPYERIILVGHSIGSLLVRKLYIVASGDQPDCPLEPPFANTWRRPWVSKVDRIVLLAGINRGWSFSRHLQIANILIWLFGLAFLSAIRWIMFQNRKRPMIERIRSGRPFISDLRLQWVVMRHRHRRERTEAPLTVQLLGSVDDLVSPEDNVDSVAGADFVYLDVPHTGHLNIVFLDPARSADRPGDDREKRASNARRRQAVVTRRNTVVAALAENGESLRRRSVTPFDTPFGQTNEKIDRIVFVIHGIRDLGYWTHKIARRVRDCGRRQKTPLLYATETSTYGYFAMLPFLLLRRREDKVAWLMDRYVEAKARYPKATFSFVGHSNGTWLLAAALRMHRGCRFEHVAFAGSVVPTGFVWQHFLDAAGKHAGQVRKVCNFVASGDLVVALFPKAFERLGSDHLGSAGHDGFKGSAVRNIRFVRGGHGAALAEEVWEAIARFTVTGDPGEIPPHCLADERKCWVRLLGCLAPFPLIAIVGVVAALGAALVFWPACLGLGQAAEWLRTLIVLAYLALVYLIVTRF